MCDSGASANALHRLAGHNLGMPLLERRRAIRVFTIGGALGVCVGAALIVAGAVIERPGLILNGWMLLLIAMGFLIGVAVLRWIRSMEDGGTPAEVVRRRGGIAGASVVLVFGVSMTAFGLLEDAALQTWLGGAGIALGGASLIDSLRAPRRQE